MKNSLFILGITLVSFANVCDAKSFVNKTIDSFQGGPFAENSAVKFTNEKNTVKPVHNESSEMFDPETVIPYNSKSMKEIIAENDKITESPAFDDFEFMVFEETMKDIIAQSELIIESNVSNETFPLKEEINPEDEIRTLEMVIESKEKNELRPLDFKKIDKPVPQTATFNSNIFLRKN